MLDLPLNKLLLALVQKHVFKSIIICYIAKLLVFSSTTGSNTKGSPNIKAVASCELHFTTPLPHVIESYTHPNQL